MTCDELCAENFCSIMVLEETNLFPWEDEIVDS